MPQRELPITLVVRTLDEEVVSAEPLLFAELHCCDSKTARLRTRMRELLKKIAEGTPVFELYRRELAEPPNVDRVRVNLPPPRRRADWIEPVQLEFDVVRWRHGTDAHLAFVPALGIEVIASKEPELRKRIPDHIIAALRRSKAAESLYELALTQRVREVALEPLALSMTVKSPKQREKDKEREVDPKPTIESVGLVLNDQSLRPAYQVESLVRQIAETLGGKGARSVLLVGPSGVGKTAAVHELVRTRASVGISSTPFWATSGSRLVAGVVFPPRVLQPH